MKIAAAIVTERGGRTCHAAIVARELGVPAVVGAEGARDTLKTGPVVTVSCAEGVSARVYDGGSPFETTRVNIEQLKRPRTAIMVNLGNPELAFRTAMLPNSGVASRGWNSSSANTSEFIRWRWSIREGLFGSRRKKIEQLVRNYDTPEGLFH